MNVCNRQTVMLLMMTVAGCASQPGLESDVAALNALQRRADEAVVGGNTEGYLALVTDDAVLMPPDHPALAGKSEIRAWNEKFVEQFIVESYSPTDHELRVHGDWAFRRASARMVLKPRSGGAPIILDAKFIIFYWRQPDGSWKIARDIFNRN